MRYLTARATAVSIILCAFAVFPAKLSAQTISAEDVTSVMESPIVKEAFESCTAGKPHDTSIDFVFIVSDNGTVALSSTDPVVDPQLLQCFQTASKNIKLKATGKKFEITYPMEFEPYQGPPPTVVATAPTPPPTGIVAVPPTTTQPIMSTQPVPIGVPIAREENPAFRKQYKAAKALTIPGAIFIPMGAIMIFAGIIYYAAFRVDCSNDCDDYEDYGCNDCSDTPVAFPVLLGVGGVVLITGAILAGIGNAKKRSALKMRYSSTYIPLIGAAPIMHQGKAIGGSASLKWTF